LGGVLDAARIPSREVVVHACRSSFSYPEDISDNRIAGARSQHPPAPSAPEPAGGYRRQLEQHADYVANLAQGKPVRIKARKDPPADGQRRGRGRPPGTPNGVTHLFLSPATIERLRAELQP
jgi:hypothetical protein